MSENVRKGAKADGLVTVNFARIEAAFRKHYTTVSEQGSSRSGKSWANMQWLIKQCVDVEGTTVSVVRKTMPAIKRSIYRDFKEIMTQVGLWSDKAMNKTEFVYNFPNGSWIEFFSCENEQKMRGSKRQILFVNEANELTFIEWQQLQMRTTLFSIIDYNPSFSEGHWINLLNQEKKTYHFISTYKDNPFLEQKVIDEIESLQWKSKTLWQVYGLGQQALVDGLVFPKFTLVDFIPMHATRHRYIGVDFGYSADSTAIVEVCLHDGKLYINELCYRTKLLTSDIIKELKAIDGEPEVISECADPRMIDEIYNAGIDIKPVKKFKGSIMAGVTKMQEYEICVTKKSINAIKEFRNYTYRQDKEGNWLNVPIDAYNHCFTGETLVMTAKGVAHIAELRLGDMVLTSKGYRKVLSVWKRQAANILAYRLTFGQIAVEVRATPDHNVKTSKGWTAFNDLHIGQTCYLQNFGKQKLTGIESSEVSKEPVYDIEVEDMHEFYANGLLVSNCIDAVRYVVLEKALGGYGSGLTAAEILDVVGL